MQIRMKIGAYNAEIRVRSLDLVSIQCNVSDDLGYLAICNSVRPPCGLPTSKEKSRASHPRARGFRDGIIPNASVPKVRSRIMVGGCAETREECPQPSSCGIQFATMPRVGLI